MRAAIYARYSSELQSPTSIEDQIRKCQQAAEQMGWEVLTDYIRSDSELSGAALAPRVALLSLINDAKKLPRPFDVIVIDDTSRFGRNLTDVLLLSDLIKSYDTFLYFASQHLNSNDKSFRLLLIMNGMIDEQFLIGLSDKVHRGQEGRVLNGLVPCGRCYGYRNVPIEDVSRRGQYGRFLVTGVRQEIVEEEAIVVRSIFQMRSEGYSLKLIACALNSEGIQSPRPRDGRNLDWSSAGIHQILNRSKYRGQIVWNQTDRVRNPETGKARAKPRPREEWVISEAPHLRIVPDELWDKAQKVGKKRPERIQTWARLGGLKKAKPDHVYLFSGLLICGCCGGPIVVAGGSGYHAKYGCANHRSNNSCSNNLRIKRVRLEEQLISQIIDVALRRDSFEYVISRFQDQLKNPPSKFVWVRDKAPEDAIQLRAERRKIDSRARSLVTAIAEGGAQESPCLLSELKHVERRIETIKNLLGETTRTPKHPDIPLERIREFVLRQASNMASLMVAEPAVAKQALCAYFKPLVLKPKLSRKGPVYVVQGVKAPGAPMEVRRESELIQNLRDRVTE